MKRRRAFWGCGAALLLAGCTTPAWRQDIDTRVQALLPADVLLFGEQHDSTEHHALEHDLVRTLAARGQLAALVIEMAEAGQDTRALPRDATESAVQTALAWERANWPWADYGPAIMAAVRAGVPVVGGNLPRSTMREAMADIALDQRLSPAALQDQRRRIEEGHCGLLPESQIAPMTRIQIARDRAMAGAIAAAAQPARTVLFIAGAGHVLRDAGVPRHLPTGLRSVVLVAQAGDHAAAPAAEGADHVWRTPATPAREHCAELRRRLAR